jgi:hypothetical protein
MKMKKLFVAVVVVLIAGMAFSACKKKKDEAKSSACEMISFKVGDDTWTKKDNSFTFTYPKGTVVTSLTPTIVVSDKATVSPTGAQDFTNSVTYTVTAEDGTTKKTYTATATVSTVPAP